MQRQWYLIDDDGIRPVKVGEETDDFWEMFQQDDTDAPWPAFSQVVVQASPTRTVEALLRTGTALGLKLDEITDRPEQWSEAILLARAEALTVVTEPGVDLDERLLAAQWSEDLFAELRVDGAFFGHDPAAGTLHLTFFRDGKPHFAWCDSLLPGPSYAMVFDADGACSDEDPRRFALRMLDMPETSPLLDRHRFVMEQLRQLGLEAVSPDLEELPIAAALSARANPSGEYGDT